jgi:hypothetical protein
MAPAPSMSEPRRYRFHPLERRGLLLGLSPGQLATLGMGVVVALMALRALPGASGAMGAIVALAGSAALGLWSIAGRPCVGWVPVTASWLTGRRRPGLWATSRPTAPPGVTVIAAPAAISDDPLGVIRDRRRGQWSAIVPVGSRSFTLLDPEDKERRLHAWGTLLAASARAGSPIHRIQWVQRATAGDADSLDAYLDRAGSPAETNAIVDAERSYRQLIAGAGPAHRGHEVLLVVTVSPRHLGRALRPFGGGGTPAICALLRRELRLIEGQLRTAEVRPGRPLDATGVTQAIRVGCEPYARRGRLAGPSAKGPKASAARLEGPTREVNPAPAAAGRPDPAWPMAIEEEWSSVRIDGRWHAVYWVSEWPRLDVGPDFMAPFLLVGGSRVVSVTMAPVSPARARREVESARTADMADEELRRRAGFLSTARHRREAEGAVHREAELANGHGEYRFSGYVSVSGTTTEELAAACAAVEQAAQQSHLELRRLYGQQREAFTWTLPLGRGVN